MPEISVVDMAGKEVEIFNLPDTIFGITPNISVMHDAVVNHLANRRHGTQSALTRSEVSGGGRKPWRQKGTGHARQGSIRSPQWTHGGMVFAVKPRSYRYSLNKKVRRLAMKSAFSSKFIDKDIVVVDSVEMSDYKTKDMCGMLKAWGAERKALIVLPHVDEKIIKSARNITGIKTSQVNTLNVYDILNAGKLVLIKEAAEKIGEVYV
jgi:large subunit ribosomal protein L4